MHLALKQPHRLVIVIKPILQTREPGTNGWPARVAQLVGDRFSFEAKQCIQRPNRGGVLGKGGCGSTSAPSLPILASSPVPPP